MRWIPTLALCLATAFAGVSARAANEIESPGSIAPGQTATLKWYFSGAKLTITGGQYVTPTVITGKQSLKVSPKKTTKYLFDLYYHPEASAQDQATAKSKLVHVQYSVTVEVLTGGTEGLAAYKGSHGWRVNYQSGWKPMTNEGANDDLIYFQPEEDAIDRMAVAVVPVKGKNASQLMDEVRSDIPSHYTNYTLLSQTEYSLQNLPAIVASFTGNDGSHPGTRTQSLLMIVVNGERGYVVSVRTSADRYKQRQNTLEKMLHSFALTGKITPADATGGGAQASVSTAAKPSDSKSAPDTSKTLNTAGATLNTALDDKAQAAKTSAKDAAGKTSGGKTPDK